MIVTTLIVLFLMTGSLVLPLKALVMNALTVSAAFGFLVFVFQDGRLRGLLRYPEATGIDFTQPILLFAVAFALSTDYGVFLLARIKEFHDAGESNEEAVALGLQRTGRIITAAALLFCAAVWTFATSRIVFVKQLGIGIGFAVLVDATLVRALLVPSLMRLLGDWNWWAPGPAAPAPPPHRPRASRYCLRSPRGYGSRISGFARRLVEVEVLREVAEDRHVLPHVRARIGPAVGARVEALAVEEEVLDELEVRVEAERLVVDVAALRVRADDEPRHADAVAVLVDVRRRRRGRRSRPSRPTRGRSRSSSSSGCA